MKDIHSIIRLNTKNKQRSITLKAGVKKVAAIHDLSGYGRCSLSVIIPVLSTLGIQVCPVPTAILSTHTDGFKDFSFLDLTDNMPGYIEHWKKIGLVFDCIYTGFLGSSRQIEIVEDFIGSFKTPHNFVLIDPVMADNGKLYKTMDKSMVCKMRNLIGMADIITPNFTEACFLLDKKYDESISVAEIKLWMKELSDMGPGTVIITSVPVDFKKSMNTVLAYERNENKFWKVSTENVPVFYPGTGDTFSSIIIGRLLCGDSLPVAIDRAVIFIKNGIKESFGFSYPTNEGILLEKVLGNLNLPYITSTYEII